jgi:5-methylcytosine-specific restriction endonuclease McrA
MAQRAGHRCEYCHAPEAIFNFSFEVEHVIPISRQGPDDDSNLALACRACNLRKSDYVTGVDEATQLEVRLFHPRQDSWDEHFRANRESGAIEGLTAIGRATIMRLDMNSAEQRSARKQWMLLGLFP